MGDYRAPPYQIPRKPLTINSNLIPGLSSASSSSSSQVRRPSVSSVYPPQYSSSNQHLLMQHVPPVYTAYQSTPYMKRRQDSSSTATTVSQGRSSSNISIQLRRSASTNTTGSLSGGTSAYVATLRKQKATVWCERSQPEDQRLLAAQKVAKQRASSEVIGSSSTTLTKGKHGIDSNGGSANSTMRGKHGKGWGTSSGSAGIGTGSVVGGPPTRLYLGESSDEEESYIPGPGLQRRSGSGHSSNNSNSNHRKSYRNSAIYGDHRSSSHGPPQRRMSTGSSGSYSPNTSSAELAPPPMRGKSKSPPSLVSPHILEETSPEIRQQGADYFASNKTNAVGADKDTLKRRGSVDESEARTMTMSGLRLVVANPD